MLALALLVSACGGNSGGSERSPEAALRQRLTASGVEAEIVECVLQLATDELRRGSLEPMLEEELVGSCRRARAVVDQGAGTGTVDPGSAGTGTIDPGNTAPGNTAPENTDTGSAEDDGNRSRSLGFGLEPDADEPATYGDDEVLDALWERCEGGDGVACDRLFDQSPIGSDYEEFGLTCGNRDQLLDCTELGSGRVE